MACFLQRSMNALQWILIGVLSLLLAGLFLGCEKLEEDPPWVSVERPLMLFTDTTLLDFYEEEILSWKLKTAFLERWSSNDKVFARPILVDIYDSLGVKVAFLRADSGTLDMKMNFVYAYGHVFAFTPKGASVRADSLLWHKRDNLVKTDSYVRVVTEDGDVLQGKGFVSDAKMDNWRILSEVTGIFQDAAKRLKKEDETLLGKSSSSVQPKPEKRKTETIKKEEPTERPPKRGIRPFVSAKDSLRNLEIRKRERASRDSSEKKSLRKNIQRDQIKTDSLKVDRPTHRRPRAKRRAE